MAARRKARIREVGWSRRLAGVGICAFFALGVMTGLSTPGKIAASRVVNAIGAVRVRAGGEVARLWSGASGPGDSAAGATALGGAIAIVERHDGFYALFARGQLRGPVSTRDQSDLPVLSGPGVDYATSASLVRYAAILVRAEAELSEMVSEMHVDGDGQMALFLDRSRTEVLLDLKGAPLEISRADRVLRRWKGHDELIAALDMTTPGEAVMRLRDTSSARARGAVAGAARELRPVAERVSRRRARYRREPGVR